ncbi:FAD/NAD(P)-binding oxidoreductase [Metarhizobium album]|uniref:FAD/NAD(P)-binding oxidoreductase n=1 Tax=Metarhizobium album TaxID=2182425 RepID=A0A2U2DK72_9HYPH|nr:NAD(P)/FAD-dependent oxidoreductase [Rhizobium album]PWE53719.1 FAD/NAD(P)-binding oxidoreductase [Rhizobium album]
MTHYDVAIVGAGPAGMSSAIEISQAGFTALLLDDQPAPGGQIYRSIENAHTDRLDILGPDYAEGKRLVAEFRSSSTTYIPNATVWNVSRDLTLAYTREGVSHGISADALIVASGAIERPTPMPGWTLPGVMTVGALQILLKAHGLLADAVVLVGSGPLIWLLAAQMIKAGAKPSAIVETLPLSHYFKALPKLRFNRPAFSYLKKGLLMMRSVKAAGVPVFLGAQGVAIEGSSRAEAVSFEIRGRMHRLPAETVALHQGIVPNQQITRLLHCDHRWSESQRSFLPVSDCFGETSVANLYIAGDGAGIGGAKVAAMQGRLAALRILEKASAVQNTATSELLAEIEKEISIRPFLEELYLPSAEIRDPKENTIVCRCEEITAGEVRASLASGVPGPNQIKSLLRTGMGPCQGRFCGLALSEIAAQYLGKTPASVGYYRIRAPLKPLRLTELANMGEAEVPQAPVKQELQK